MILIIVWSYVFWLKYGVWLDYVICNCYMKDCGDLVVIVKKKLVDLRCVFWKSRGKFENIVFDF